MTNRECILGKFKELQVELFDYELIEDQEGIFLIRNKNDRSNMSYIGWTEGLKGAEFVARREGSGDEESWSLEEAVTYLRGGMQ